MQEKERSEKGSNKIYKLASKRGKTKETPGYNAVPFCTRDRDDVYVIWWLS